MRRNAMVWFALAPVLAAQNPEARSWRTEYLPPPPETAIEVGGMAFLPDGRLAVSTRCGQVWLVEGALADDPRSARWQLFADGLDEGLGLAVRDGTILVLQRGELSRLLDRDGDGRCDRIERVSAGWGLSGNYHEFAFGLPYDAEGNAYATLNLGFLDKAWWHGKSLGRWRGFALRIAPNGAVTPFANGFRSPDGVALSPSGELFVTDNQGDWMPACGVFHVREGAFHGHPASLRWPSDVEPSDTVPPQVARTEAAVWMPYDLSRSTGNLAWDTTGGKFGPFGGDAFAAELTNGLVARLLLEKVRGEWQGAAIAFRHDVGSAHRLLFAPDGTLLIGLTNRGWGGAGKAHGITRLRFTGEVPMDVTRCRLVDGGFDLEFTHALENDVTAASVRVRLYDYVWWWKYGSPESSHKELPCTLAQDGKLLRVRCAGLEPGYCARILLSGIVGAGGRTLLHDRLDYTLRQLPSGPPCTKPIARVVPPPKTREEDAEGWIALHDASSLAGFTKHAGFRLADSPGIAGEVTKLAEKAAREAQPGALLCDTGPGELVTRFPHGDAHVRLEFMLPRGGRAELLLQGRYGIVLADTLPGAPDADSCGAIHCGPQRVAPRVLAYERAGEWQSLDVWFEAPEVLAEGTRTRKARFARVELNHRLEINQGKVVEDPARWLVHEDVDVEAEDERKEAPLALRSQGPIAIRRLEVRALGRDALPTRSRQRFEGVEVRHDLSASRAAWMDGATLRVGCRVSAGGGANLVVDGIPIGLTRNRKGVTARTGSALGIAELATLLIPFEETWFELEVTRSERHLAVRLNGIAVVEAPLPEGDRQPTLVLERADAATVVELR